MTASSVNAPEQTRQSTDDVTVHGVSRLLAMAATVLLLWSFLSILWHVTTVVGGRTALIVVVAVALLLATACAHILSERAALLLGAGTFVLGAFVYSLAVPEPYLGVATISVVIADAYVLLTGNLSIMRIIEADVWARSMAPAPVFLTWYLAIRRRYELTAMVGMAALGLFVLTGDAPTTTTLIGATSALALLGFGALEEMDGDWRVLLDLGLLLAVAVVAARLVQLVPGRGLATGPNQSGGGLGPPTMEGTLVTADDELQIFGGVSLSPTARFTVTAQRAAFWHAGAYDRYTGESWLRSGQSTSYQGRLQTPPGETEELVQTYEAQSPVAALPAAWRPMLLRTLPRANLEVTSTGALAPTEALDEGDSYTVISELPSWSREELREADTTYPGHVTERYLQLPETTPDRLAEFTDDITAHAETPYDTAVAIERWLAENKGYSLNVGKPSGDVAAGFVFRMTAGYCTYFATAMVAMLRTQGIPARFAVGYTPGEQLDQQTWLVRGLNSHAWVEIYFPDIGWVPFDPTPGTPRREEEQSELDRAREAGTANVDADSDETDGTGEDGTDTPTPTPTPTESPGEQDPVNETTPANDSLDPGLGGDPDILNGTPVPTPSLNPEDQIAAGYAGEVTATTPEPGAAGGSGPGGTIERVAGGRDRVTILAGVAGVALGAYRLGLAKQGYEAIRVRVQWPTESPDQDAVVAYERLELLLARQFRERLDGETPRLYVQSLRDHGVDDRASRVVEIYERARYGSGITRAGADEAIELVNELVGEYGRF